MPACRLVASIVATALQPQCATDEAADVDLFVCEHEEVRVCVHGVLAFGSAFWKNQEIFTHATYMS